MKDEARRGGYALPPGLIRRELGDIVEEAPNDTYDRQTGLPVRGYTDGLPTDAEPYGPPKPTYIPIPEEDVSYRIADPVLKPYHKRIKPYESFIADTAKKYNVEPELVKAVVYAESSGNPKARSSVGAGGLMQLMPGTARMLGVANRFDPEQNIEGGVKYIRKMLDRFGDEEQALAAYNAGPGNVRKYGGVPPFRETQKYIKKVRDYRDRMKKEVKRKALPAKPPEVVASIGTPKQPVELLPIQQLTRPIAAVQTEQEPLFPGGPPDIAGEPFFIDEGITRSKKGKRSGRG